MTKELSKENSTRYYLLDSIRGICILGMIVYHTLFDVVAFFGVYADPLAVRITDIIRDFGASCFICLSGICIHFGNKPLKRFWILFGASTLVTLITWLFMPDMPIVFGILTFMSFAALLMLPLKRYLDKLPAAPFAVLCFVLFIFFFEVQDGYFGWYTLRIAAVPEVLYKNIFTAFLGFPAAGFVSSDYYPVLPWLFMFLFGFFLWKCMARSKTVLKILNFRIRFLEKIGRLSLYIYIAHQPIILGIMLAVMYLSGLI